MQIRTRPLSVAALALGLVGAFVASAQSVAPDGVAAAAMGPASASMSGPQQLVVRLSDAPLATVAGNKRTGMRMSASEQRAYLQQLAAKQSALEQQISDLGGVTQARVSKAHNALIVSIDATKIPDLKRLPGVASIRPVVTYDLDLSTTVPYIGAAAAQAAGTDGTGIRVAVLDSGIDFMHKNLGGPGTVADYGTCYAQRTVAPSGICASYFGPGAPKVVGGYDFVGEVWPGGARAEDPNPIDGGSAAGHGTHVADIIAGKSADGTHKGVAPGAQLYAVKVCSSVSTSCNGDALLLGMDFALDPNGDNDISDAVDVVNMSLGSSYGQREDDLSAASATASRFGVVVVASAGNSADRPFILGSPSSTPEVISVAQTSMPTAQAFPLVINSPASIAGTYSNTNTVDWAPLGAGFTGDVLYTGSAPISKPLACGATDLPAGSLAGKVALIDRGTCAISIKVHNAATAGAIGVLIANNTSGDAPTFSFGGPTPFTPAPTLILTQSTGIAIKSRIAAAETVNVTASPASAISLAGSMAATSSRGPSYSYGAIKPDIGAPGASLSAEYGTGSGETFFGGTSGAAPMVAGSAALVLQANPSLLPHEVKARLMNAAETNVFTNPATLPGQLAPITRIGAGEVRVNKSLSLTTGAWDAADPASVGLSVGAYRNIGTQVFRKKVVVRNYSGSARNYTITPSFRYANDQASGALSISAPASIAVGPNGSAVFTITMTLNANLLPAWNLNGGSNGGNGALLNLPEYDGYVAIADATDTVRLPWHILPHKAANARPAAGSVALGGAPSGSLGLTNAGGAVAGQVDVFMLTGTSPQIPSASLPRPGDNFAIIDLKSVGARVVSAGAPNDTVQFAITTFGQRSHPNYPAEFDVYVDTNNDGSWDYVVYTVENGAFATTGQNVVTVRNLATSATIVRYFDDADLSSSNVVLTAALSDLGGITAGTQFTFRVIAFDNYFTGVGTDVIGPMQVTLGAPRFGFTDAASVPVNGAGSIAITRNPAGDAASPSQSGLLLMYRNGLAGREADAIPVAP
jgi:subtilisin family serine protease